MTGSENGRSTSSARCDIAIVGMACTFAQARTPEQFWQNIVSKVDAVKDFAPERFDPEWFYDPSNEERIYCKKGGWVDSSFTFSPLQFGVMPAALEGAEPDHFLVLRTVQEALQDAGYGGSESHKLRAGIVLGKGNYLGPGVCALIFRGVVTEQVLAIIKGLHPEFTPKQLEQIKICLRSSLPKFNAEVAGGLIPNITTGRVANRLDLMGPNFTIDAACASSLIATELGSEWLASGKGDIVLVGGVHIFSSIPFLQVFGTMKALSPSSTIRPYDEECDGTIAGEGVGILVLKRLKDAERDGDRIYAVIRGIGSSSDGRAKGITAPRVEGEELALRRAYESCGLPPECVELIEGHGTGTPVGDSVELEALRRVFGPSRQGRPNCAIGSVKSMIGHAMPAAGAAGLIKAALALYHRVLPPTLNCRKPRPSLLEPDSPFYVNTETRPWIHRSDGEPRRAGVNAFGFGGINAHVVLEEYRGNKEYDRPTLLREWETELIVIEAETGGLRAEVDRLRKYVTEVEGVALRDIAYTLNTSLRGLPQRLSIVAGSLADLAQKLDSIRARLSDAQCKQVKDRQGLYYLGESAIREGKTALLLPGEGSQYLNMLAELCIHFPEVRAAFDRADDTVKDPRRWPPSAVIFPAPSFSEEELKAAEARLWTIDRATEAVLTADGAIVQLLHRLGLKADMMAGHSAGEWVGLAASGVIDPELLPASMGRLSAMYRRLAEDSSVPSVAMLAVGAGREKVQELLREIDCDVCVANDNCPHQIVIVVDPKHEERVTRHLQLRSVFVEKLPYDRGYHTPAFTYICEPLRECFSAMEIRAPLVPLYSCTTASPYPSAPDEILKVISNTFSRPLLFVQTIEAMYKAGARIFVEAGPRGNLTAFVDDILRGRPHLTIAVDQPRRSGLTALNHALGLLAAAGVPLSLGHLYERRSPRKLAMDVRADRTPSEDSVPGAVQVSTCYARLQVPPPLEKNGSKEAPALAVGAFETVMDSVLPPAPGGPPVTIHRPVAAAALEDHFSLMEQFLETQEAVMLGVLGRASAAGVQNSDSVKLELGPAAGAIASALLVESAPSHSEPESSDPALPPASTAVTLRDAAREPPASQRSLADVLLATVSEKTGYPVETLDLDLDMEADLGIDSIKRVEILGAMQQLAETRALSSDAAMEEVARLKTLRQVLAFLEKASGTEQVNADQPPSAELGPLLRTAVILSQVPGESVSLRCEVDADEHLYLHDHCLYFHGPEQDNQCVPLMSMPLTCSLEWMAEAAGILCPGLRVVGAREIQAFRRINVTTKRPLTALLITATRADAHTVRVAIRSEESGEAAETAAGEILAQATIVFATDFPRPAALRDPELKGRRKPARTAQEIYTDHRMFHGPSFQGVVSLTAIGENGILGRLKVLPTDHLLRSEPNPRFRVDAFTLDAAGQMVGYWPIEYLDEGYVVLPIRIEEVTLFRENLRPGEEADCRVQIKAVSHRQLKADFEVIGPDGALWMRAAGWEDWRFYWDQRLYDFWRFPNKAPNGRRVEFAALEKAGVECMWLDLMEGADRTGLWEALCVHMVLNRSELEEYWASADSDARRQWVLRKAIAKDAVRMWIERRYDRHLYPTDIRIRANGSGTIEVEGAWTNELPTPCVSAACRGNVAVAAAGERETGVAIGVAAHDDGLSDEACSEEEQERIRRIGEDGEWPTRALCAKKAAAQFLGLDPDDIASLRSLLIAEIQESEGRFVLAGENTTRVAVDTARDGEFVVAATCG